MIKGNVIRQANDGGNTWIDCSEEAFKRAKENGTPVREVHLNDESFRAAFDVWQDKTDWVQKDRRFDVLKPWGMHRADVLKAFIEHLEDRISVLEESGKQVINARDHYKRIAMASAGFRASDEYRAQGAEILKAKIEQAMGRVKEQCKPDDWPFLEQVMLGMRDSCDVVAKELRENSIPEKFRFYENNIRSAYESFMEKRFGESVDRRRAKNGDAEYMAWDMLIGWIIWQHCLNLVSKPTPAGYHIMNEAGEVCADRKTLSEAKKVVEDWNANWVIKPYFYGVS